MEQFTDVANKQRLNPITENLVYNINALPSTVENYNFSVDATKFKKEWDEITKKHHKWLIENPDANHRCPVSNFPLTSGELSILYFQKQYKDTINGTLQHKKRTREKLNEKKFTAKLYKQYEREELLATRKLTSPVQHKKQRIVE